MARARMDLDVARKDHAVLERLAAKQAATRQEVDEAARRVESAELRLQDLARRRAALVDPSDRTVATAKLHDAEAAVDLARLRLDKSLIRAPITGMVYDTDVRTGSYVNLGDTLAKVGRTGKVRVQVYVDEPELGRVAVGMPVTITWDALQGRRWQGAVERMPTEIMSLGTRHVGEVPCVIENPGGELIPGTNINAEIRSHVAPDALSIPREALRREDGVTGVFLLQRDRIVWRKVTPGISSITRTQIVEGLSEGDAVALPSDTHLVSGALIRPEFR